MVSLTKRGIPLCSISPRYLHTNSTSHTWPFSAIAELIDNAYDPDVNAKQFWINKTEIKGQDCLIFMDNGKGMDYKKMHKMLSFGFNDKHTVRGHVPVGLYGNGFKSGSMRLGKDAIVFSKKAGTMCVGLLSQTYHETTGAQNVIVPIVMFTKSGQTVSATPTHAECLNDILTHSLFNTKEELLSEFSIIDKMCANTNGTRIIIWNLRRTTSGVLEFDFTRDCYDIRIPVGVNENTRDTNKQWLEDEIGAPESEYSLRAYCSILYLKPRMQIIIQGQKVETRFVTKSLANVLQDTYNPTFLKKKIKITFGYNTKSKEHYGIMMYHNNRLIKAYERVACQRKANRTGVGVIGVIECNFLTPTHNKQDFDNTKEYRNIMLNVGCKLEEYWKEVRYRYKNCTKAFEDVAKQPDQNWVQCDDCLKWRKLPDCIDEKLLSADWFCHMNPDPQFRSCKVKEEPENSDEEQTGYQKTYKQHEKIQKLQEEKNRQQRTTALIKQATTLLRKEQDIVRQLRSSCPPTPSSSIPAHPKPSPPTISLSPKGSSPSDDTSVHTQEISVSTTPTRKRTLLQSQEHSTDKKKARQKDFDKKTLDSLLTSTTSPAVFRRENKAEKDIKTAPKYNSGMIDKSTMKNDQSNEITQANSEDQQNYKFKYLQAKEEIKQLQHKLDSLDGEKYNLLTSYELLKKDFEEIKRENEKVKRSVEDQWVQTEFPISSHEEKAATSAEVSNSERGRDSDFGTQQHPTQDRPESGPGNSSTQMHSLRLRELRQRVERLLLILVPSLDLQQMNYDYEVIDEILAQVINELSPTEAASM